MPTQLHLGDESQIKMPDVFGRTNAAALRHAQAAAELSAPIPGERYRDVKLNVITGESPLQLRACFDPEHDEEDRALVESLESDGQRVPVLLLEDPHSQAPALTILDGHRRIAALRQSNRETVKAVIFNQGSLECDLITLTANVRKHLRPLEQARAIARLRERHKLTVEEIAKRVGLSSRYITELKALLETDPAVQAALERGEIKAKAALVLGQAPREQQAQLAEIAAATGLSETDARRLVARIQGTGEPPEQASLALGISVGESTERAKPTADAPSSAESEAHGTLPAGPTSNSKHGQKPGQVLTTAAAVTLIQSCFPEIEARAVQSLAELAVQHSANVNTLKAAGLLTLGGVQMETAVTAAQSTANNSAVRQLLRVVDAFVDVRILIGKGRCPPECAPMLVGLASQAAELKRAVASTWHKKKGTRHGTPQSAE